MYKQLHTYRDPAPLNQPQSTGFGLHQMKTFLASRTLTMKNTNDALLQMMAVFSLKKKRRNNGTFSELSSGERKQWSYSGEGRTGPVLHGLHSCSPAFLEFSLAKSGILTSKKKESGIHSMLGCFFPLKKKWQMKMFFFKSPILKL